MPTRCIDSYIYRTNPFELVVQGFQARPLLALSSIKANEPRRVPFIALRLAEDLVEPHFGTSLVSGGHKMCAAMASRASRVSKPCTL